MLHGRERGPVRPVLRVRVRQVGQLPPHPEGQRWIRHLRNSQRRHGCKAHTGDHYINNRPEKDIKKED